MSKGKYGPDMLWWMIKESLSSDYGWKPEEIDKMKMTDINRYLAVRAGRIKRMKEESEKK